VRLDLARAVVVPIGSSWPSLLLPARLGIRPVSLAERVEQNDQVAGAPVQHPEEFASEVVSELPELTADLRGVREGQVGARWREVHARDPSKVSAAIGSGAGWGRPRRSAQDVHTYRNHSGSRVLKPTIWN
jgi:hypothetical protein